MKSNLTEKELRAIILQVLYTIALIQETYSGFRHNM